MRILIVIASLSITQFVAAQGKLNLFALKIDKDSLNYDSSKKSMLVPYTFSDFKSNCIIYGLPGFPNPVPFDLSDLCKVKAIGTGVAFAVYRPDGKREAYRITIRDNFDRKPVTREVLDSIFRVSRERFIKNKRIVSEKDTVSVVREVQLEDFLLEPGLYYFQLVYYCGENVFNTIGAEETKRSRSRIFQGCVMSNIVPFVVK